MITANPSRIDMPEGSPHNQLLEDYRHWLWNCQ